MNDWWKKAFAYAWCSPIGQALQRARLRWTSGAEVTLQLDYAEFRQLFEKLLRWARRGRPKVPAGAWRVAGVGAV